jgi:hypothetical protein
VSKKCPKSKTSKTHLGGLATVAVGKRIGVNSATEI